MSMPPPDRRRSERLLLAISIRVEGVNSKGEKFSENTHTVLINRHGARIQLKQKVAPGSAVSIANLAANRHAEFRVVGPTQPFSAEGGEWGVEYKDQKANIWGIDFPPVQDEGRYASAMLECRRCHSTALASLSLVEHDVLSSAGIITRDCPKCGQATPWSYGELQPPEPGAKGITSAAASASPAPWSKPRAHSRASLKLPIRVRGFYGTVDITKTENVSKGGLCFISDADYEIGEGILVTCPYDPAGQNIEVKARVVRRNGVEGTKRKIYGIQYDREL